jgi:hypothetical protein
MSPYYLSTRHIHSSPVLNTQPEYWLDLPCEHQVTLPLVISSKEKIRSVELKGNQTRSRRDSVFFPRNSQKDTEDSGKKARDSALSWSWLEWVAHAEGWRATLETGGLEGAGAGEHLSQDHTWTECPLCMQGKDRPLRKQVQWDIPTQLPCWCSQVWDPGTGPGHDSLSSLSSYLF